MLQKEAAWVLGNVAFAAGRHIPDIIQAGAVAPMIGLLSSTEFPVQNVSVQGLANIASFVCGRQNALDHGVVTPLLA